MSSIKIIQTNIAELSTDFVVNAANRRLQAGSGVCGAIFRAAGEEQLQEACDKIGGCEVGHAVVTPGFDLPAKYIIHAVGPVWNGGNNGEEEQLYSCYRTSMEFVRTYGGHSIAFPILSSGVFGYPKEEAWKVAVRAVRDDLKQHGAYSVDVIFAVNSRQSYDIGMKILEAEQAEPVCGKMHYRLYTIDGLQDISVGKMEFVAEFADRKLADHYCRYMLGKKRFDGKGIAVAEVPADEALGESRVSAVITPDGRVLNMPAQNR